MLDVDALAEATATIVREHIAAAMEPLLTENKALRDRIEALEVREPAPGRPGKDVDPEALRQMVADEVSTAVAALPPAKDGRSVELADVVPLIGKEVQRAVAALPAARDGVGLAGAFIDRAGSLVVTLTDGTTRDLGIVVGSDADEVALHKRLAEMVASLPPPRDGVDGADALGFDDLQFDHDGERGFVLRFVRGDQVKEFPFTIPVTIDRGVFREDRAYTKGDGVTWAGSFWIAQEDTTAKPDSGAGWRLAVKRGRDARSPI